MKVVGRKQFDEHLEIITGKINALRKSLSKSENACLSIISGKRSRRNSFLEVKAKIHDMFWSTVYHRGHRYDVRAADREAIQVEQKAVRSSCDNTVTTFTGTAIRRQNFGEKSSIKAKSK
ncbi:unnamed protein product [Cercopithifilaria johnstoni]|uniref:Uncharacterized protein n=1 Tax=Cercopithifilaria johnstoni TaxID=2874296 RepID=A0A8J2PZW1_9BILA|nr:unnamed protein product [Cercopithifilaria johnstoni]